MYQRPIKKRQKRDRIDSRKICRELRDQSLRGIHVPDRDQLEDRELLRARSKLVKDLTQCKNRIKRLLNFYGVEIPGEFGEHSWNKAFIEWLEKFEFNYPSGTLALHVLVEELKYIRLLKKMCIDVWLNYPVINIKVVYSCSAVFLGLAYWER
jgi:transposase